MARKKSEAERTMFKKYYKKKNYGDGDEWSDDKGFNCTFGTYESIGKNFHGASCRGINGKIPITIRPKDYTPRMKPPVRNYTIGGFVNHYFIVESTSGKDGIKGFKTFLRKHDSGYIKPLCMVQSFGSVHCRPWGGSLKENDVAYVKGRATKTDEVTCTIVESDGGKKNATCVMERKRFFPRKVKNINKFTFAGHMVIQTSSLENGIDVSMGGLFGNKPRCKVIKDGGKKTLKCSS